MYEQPERSMPLAGQGGIKSKVFVCYTVEKKVRIKTVVVCLWFDMAHLTDSLLKLSRFVRVAGVQGNRFVGVRRQFLYASFPLDKTQN